MKIKPLRENIVLRRLDAEEEKIGSIIVPDTAKEKPMTAEVVAVGAGKVLKDGSRQAPEVEVGQQVLIGKYSGSEVKIDGEDYLIVREGRDPGHRRLDGPPKKQGETQPQWPRKSFTTRKPGRPSCAASTNWRRRFG